MINKLAKYYMLIIIATITSCSQNNNQSTEINWGYNYFPIDTTSSKIYKITHIHIDAPAGVFDTTVYYEKQIITEQFKDNEGRTAYRIYKYKADTQDNQWTQDSLWWLAITQFELIVYQNNKPYVKLSFPIEENKQWDGNKYNADTTQTYTVTNFQQPYTINGNTYNNTITVLHKNISTEINKDYEAEIYAKNIGLIYSVTKQLYSSYSIGQGIPIEDRIETGDMWFTQLINQ